MGYNHITIFERESILLGTLQGLSIAKIAENPSRSKSTISRELKRNSQDGNYSPIIADNRYRLRRKNCKTDKKLSDKALCGFVADRFLNRQWSPEEISGRVRAEAREQTGHLEADAVLGKKGGACLTTPADRRSRLPICRTGRRGQCRPEEENKR